ncbi:MAG: flagellar hook-length control protein FliK, partial [Betaproteobacteria bacterium HGW-Betaproteobacteria-21]
MIPADLAARLRLLNEASFFNTDPPVAGLQRAREIQAQLPELVPGQRFFATLQRTLPDGTFQALVAGKQVTLALNTSAKAGDTLELVVAETTPKAVLARLANPEAAQANSSAQSTLSQTGKLISFLLTGQPASKPVVLANNQPLLTTPPANGAALVPMLRQAVAQSGLFYESHQAQWLSGKTDLAALMREPQAQAAATPGSQAAQLAARPGPASGTAAQAAGNAAVAAGAAGSENARGIASALGTEAAITKAGPVAERTLPVVHQQLDALATNQYAWHGFAWPGQRIE